MSVADINHSNSPCQSLSSTRLSGMVRWEPGATDRLRVAALELYVEQGFEQTTVGEIAKSVGLTERTFFRHFADKKEVLFDGQDQLQKAFVAAVGAAPAGPPFDLIAAALTTTAE